jgi:hypothetical protein
VQFPFNKRERELSKKKKINLTPTLSYQEEGAKEKQEEK